MENSRSNHKGLEKRPPVATRFLTIRYLVAFGLLGGLALGNYLILRIQFETSEFTSAVYAETEQQRSRLQGSALLSQKLMASSNPMDRAAVKEQLVKMLAALQSAHERLVHDDLGKAGLPGDVREIYFETPWRLDSEMKKYIAEAHALAKAPDNELNWLNPHFLYIDRAAMSSKMVEALKRVAAVYQSESQQKTTFLRWLAIWSIGSTIVVLVISGLWIFHPMVRRMQRDMEMLQQLNETLKRLATIGNMVADVAHESRNSLQQMQACVGLLEDRTAGDEKARELLADLQKAQDRLHRLFEDLRGYVAPVVLDSRPCDLRKPVENAWNALSSARRNRNALLQFRPTGVEAICQADPLRLEQIFRNLMENSLEAGGDPLVVEVEFTEVEHRGSPAIRIAVRDNGPGFTPEQRQQVFEPFYTTKNQGTGLGLAIVKRIVESHQGEVSLVNHRPRGAEFHIVLPKGTP